MSFELLDDTSHHCVERCFERREETLSNERLTTSYCFPVLFCLLNAEEVGCVDSLKFLTTWELKLSLELFILDLVSVASEGKILRRRRWWLEQVLSHIDHLHFARDVS